MYERLTLCLWALFEAPTHISLTKQMRDAFMLAMHVAFLTQEWDPSILGVQGCGITVIPDRMWLTSDPRPYRWPDSMDALISGEK
jgi:hypothetical protein